MMHSLTLERIEALRQQLDITDAQVLQLAHEVLPGVPRNIRSLADLSNIQLILLVRTMEALPTPKKVAVGQ